MTIPTRRKIALIGGGGVRTPLVVFGINEAARQLGVDVDQTLMVGDNIHDVEAAHAAGMRCVAVSYGYHHCPPSEFNADHLIDQFGELPPLVINPTSNRSETGRDPDLVSSTHPSSSGPERLA